MIEIVCGLVGEGMSMKKTVWRKVTDVPGGSVESVLMLRHDQRTLAGSVWLRAAADLPLCKRTALTGPILNLCIATDTAAYIGRLESAHGLVVGMASQGLAHVKARAVRCAAAESSLCDHCGGCQVGLYADHD